MTQRAETFLTMNTIALLADGPGYKSPAEWGQFYKDLGPASFFLLVAFVVLLLIVAGMGYFYYKLSSRINGPNNNDDQVALMKANNELQLAAMRTMYEASNARAAGRVVPPELTLPNDQKTTP